MKIYAHPAPVHTITSYSAMEIAVNKLITRAAQEDPDSRTINVKILEILKVLGGGPSFNAFDDVPTSTAIRWAGGGNKPLWIAPSSQFVPPPPPAMVNGPEGDAPIAPMVNVVPGGTGIPFFGLYVESQGMKTNETGGVRNPVFKFIMEHGEANSNPNTLASLINAVIKSEVVDKGRPDLTEFKIINLAWFLAAGEGFDPNLTTWLNGYFLIME